MRYRILIFFVLSAIISNSQEVNDISVIGNGFGKSENEAISSALRNSIEKAVGVFIVSSSEVINDELVKDQINSVATGNIIDYSVISLLKDETGYKATVSANISPDKLVISLNNQVGSKFEVKGNVYAQNAMKEKFYKEQEPLIIKSLMDQYAKVPFFDISVHMAEPKSSLNFESEISDFDIYRKGMNDSVTNIFRNKIFYASSTIRNRTPEKKLLTDEVQIFKRDCPKETAKHADKYWVMEFERKSKLCAFKEGSAVPFYVEDLSQVRDFKKDFFIDFLFFPKINKNYISFVEGLVKMLDEISISDLDAYSKVSKTPPIILSFSSIELISSDVIKELTGIHQFTPPSEITHLPKSVQKETQAFWQDVDGYFFYLRNKESIKLLTDFFGSDFGSEVVKKMIGAQNFTSDFIDFNKLRKFFGNYNDLCHLNGSQFLNETTKNPKERVVHIYPFIQIDPSGVSKLTYEPFIVRKTLTTEELNTIKSLEFKPIKN
jgi:hypothetical protein